MNLRAFLRLFFRLLYHQLAPFYDLVAWTVSLGRWNKWVESVIPLVQPGRMLELGFGPGHLQLGLRKHGFTPFGIDASPHMARQARQNLRKAGLPSLLSQADAAALPFPNASFDCLIATFPSEYIVAPATLHEARRVLTRDGKFIILLAASVLPNSNSNRFIHWLFKVTGQSPAWDEKYLAPFRSAGFRVQEPHLLEVQNSTLLVIQLENQ